MCCVRVNTLLTDETTVCYLCLSRAINLNPNDPHIWNSLGVLYYAFGQCRESLGMLSRAVYLDPMLPEAWYNVRASSVTYCLHVA